MSTDATEAVLLAWGDNPSSIDYLGFDDFVEPIIDVVESTSEPITVGIQGLWGSGKSTVLKMVERRLVDRADLLVISINPWEFDEQDDVKGTIIAAVLRGLEQGLDADDSIRAKIKGLVRRVSWSRVGTALAKGALTMQWDVEALVTAFTPDAVAEDEDPKSMAGFRLAFAELLVEIPTISRVVVLVDDLDRCLPRAVMATFEAIKLFLSVPKVAFIIAADHQMVTDAVAASLGETHRSVTFANLYIDKIVQIPIAVPQLTEHDAEAYIALLLAERRHASQDVRDQLAEHVRHRRNRQLVPYLDEAHASCAPLPEERRLAAQIAAGLGADQLGTPRGVKRFMNGLTVRQRIAATRGITTQIDLLAKLFLLEQRFPAMLKRLAESSPETRRATLGSWETWALDGSGEDEAPEGMAPAARSWAATAPALADADLDAYFTFAASLHRVTVAPGVSDTAAAVVRGLLDNSEAARRSTLKKAAALESPELRQVIDTLVREARRSDDPSRPLDGIIRLAELPNTDTEVVAVALREMAPKLDLGLGALVAASPALTDVVVELLGRDDVGAGVKAAMRPPSRRDR